MPKHYVYRMDHDTGFAPNVNYGLCSLAGCKQNTVEKNAEKGSWIIGIGGNNTGKPNRIIYVMEVEEKLPINQFKKQYPKKSKYLTQDRKYTNALVSRKFYYFGNKAIDLPEQLQHIIWKRRGCKCMSDEDINKLKRYVSERYSYGKLGNCCNPQSKCK